MAQPACEEAVSDNTPTPMDQQKFCHEQSDTFPMGRRIYAGINSQPENRKV